MRRRRPARWLLAAAAGVAALLLCEVVLRLAGFSHPNFYQPDPSLGWVLRPGEEAWWRREGEALVRVNRAGQRDRERTTDKPADTWRLAVLGDSVVEAVQVPLEATFPQLLEPRLRACAALAGRRVEVLNFGVSGYGTAQELLLLRERAAAYAPDAVLLTFFAANDVANNLRELDDNPTRPYFRLDPTGALELDDSFRDGDAFRLRQRAGLLYVLGNRSRLVQLGKATATAWRARSRGETGRDPAAEVGLEEPVFRPPQDPEWRQAWEVTEALLAQLQRDAAALGASFGVVAATIPLQVHPDAAVRRRATTRLGVGDLDYADRRLVAIGERHGFPVLPLAPALRELAEHTGRYLHGFANTVPGTGHWNAAGHAAAADRVAVWACDALASPGPRRDHDGEGHAPIGAPAVAAPEAASDAASAEGGAPRATARRAGAALAIQKAIASQR
jgi:lysophospholipase L1-like esterase